MEFLDYISPSSYGIPPAIVILVLPLLTFILQSFFGKKLPGKGKWLATTLMAIAAVLAFRQCFQFWGPEQAAPFIKEIEWFAVEGAFNLSIGIYIDKIAALMLLLVTGITVFVLLFSMEYMKGEAQEHRYWGYLGLFSFSMIGIVLASNLIFMFVFWELVGLSSYFLIGFWHKKEGPARASQKAFIINRIGDVGFLVGILLLWIWGGDLTISTLDAGLEESQRGIISLCLFLGCVAKSAQFPLQVWLPDAMEGPTPASSLIHAATMVAAGVYMMVRVSPLLTESTMIIITFVGAITAFMAAFSAITQYDIKRVLAYSTISQLGFMVMAIGAGAKEWAFFHLATHAFFKCGLFLVAGAIIHTLHRFEHDLKAKNIDLHFDPQDIRNMGGLRKHLPVTFGLYMILAGSLAGIPLLSGFLSKEGILLQVWGWGEGQMGGYGKIAAILGLCAAGMTAFYMTRHALMIFFGKNRLLKKLADTPDLPEIKSIPWKMVLPIFIMAVMSLGSIWHPDNPFNGEGSWLIHGLTAQLETITLSTAEETAHVIITFSSYLLAVIGIAIAIGRFKPEKYAETDHKIPEVSLSFHHFYFDVIYEKLIAQPMLWIAGGFSWIDKKVVDGAVNGIANLVVRNETDHTLSGLSRKFDESIIDRLVNGLATGVLTIGAAVKRIQLGKVQLYLVFTIAGAVLLLGLYLIYFAGQ